MQMGRIGITGIPQQRQNLSRLHAIANLDAKAAGLQVRVVRITAAPELQAEVVACDGLERDRYSQGLRLILRNSVF